VTCAVITLCVASQRVFIGVSVYFVNYTVRELLDTPSYSCTKDIHSADEEMHFIYVIAVGCTVDHKECPKSWNPNFTRTN